MPFFIFLISALISIVMLVFWSKQFLRLMDMKIEKFSAREDKVIWVIVFFLTGVFGALLFYIKFVYTVQKELQRQYQDGLRNTLDISYYRQLIEDFPEYQENFEAALAMNKQKRSGLQDWYICKREEELLYKYRSGKSAYDKDVYGILLAVMHVREMDFA